MKHEIIELPNNNAIAASAIVAVRTMDREIALKFSIKPRVLVDFTTGDFGNSITIDCDDNSARDKLAADITTKWKEYRKSLPPGSH